MDNLYQAMKDLSLYWVHTRLVAVFLSGNFPHIGSLLFKIFHVSSPDSSHKWLKVRM